MHGVRWRATTMPLTLATFNVKNLLEPAAPRGQTAEAAGAGRALLAEKVAWIARTLHECDADVVGLQEIGPPELLDAVLAALPGTGYGRPILGTPDPRGIRCALVSRAPVALSQVHTAEALDFPVYRTGDPPPFGRRIPLRRGVVHARVEAAGLGPVDVLVAHFKSALAVPLRDASGREVEATSPRDVAEGTLRSLVWRAAEALHVRGVVDALLAARPGSLVAVTGDLNDVPGSVVVRTVQADGDGALLDCAARIPPERRFSSIHAAAHIQIDHVLASRSLYARLTAARFVNATLREHLVAPGGDEPPTVDSDHAPLVVRFD
jgi:endonuclease/exonuclease/phosphatase family metal-dependent hydrolase